MPVMRSWRLMSPNQRVRSLYFQMLEAAEAHKLPRQQSETPDQFAGRLDDSLSAAADEQRAIDALTDAFVVVRYAGEEADAAQTEALKRLLAKIRSVFAARKMDDPAP